MKQHLFDGFRARFGTPPEIITRAPGRLEILGNHTDYNEGVVLSVAVDRSTWFAASPRQDGHCCIYDLRDHIEANFPVTPLPEPVPGEWTNYIKGIIAELQKRTIEVPGFNGVLYSTIPMSAGMSSSAALEMSVALALGELAGADLPWVEWARIGQASENNYVGAHTGLLDQFSSLKGVKDQLVFSDFRSLEVSNVPLPPGTALVVANSMVKHALTNEYNERRERCEEAVSVLQREFAGVTALRDVTHTQLDSCQAKMDTITYRRALHVVGENERVMAGAAALQAGNLEEFGALMFASHESSRVNFENSCPELDQLVAIAQSLPGAIGARLSGGGFGGITVHLVHQKQAETYAQRLHVAYENLTGKATDVMICHADDGATRI